MRTEQRRHDLQLHETDEPHDQHKCARCDAIVRTRVPWFRAASREQVEAARIALGELTAYCSDDEDDEFLRLNWACHVTQAPLSRLQRWWLYMRSDLHEDVCERHRR